MSRHDAEGRVQNYLENLDPHLRGFDGKRLRDASWESAWHMKKRFAIFMNMEDMSFYILHRCFPNSIMASAPTATSAVSENVATCPMYNNIPERLITEPFPPDRTWSTDNGNSNTHLLSGLDDVYATLSSLAETLTAGYLRYIVGINERRPNLADSLPLGDVSGMTTTPLHIR